MVEPLIVKLTLLSGAPHKVHMSMAGWAIRPVNSVCHGFTSVHCFYAGIDKFENLKWPCFSLQWLQCSTTLYVTPYDLHDRMDVKKIPELVQSTFDITNETVNSV